MENSFEDRLYALEDRVEKLSGKFRLEVQMKLEEYFAPSMDPRERFELNLVRLEVEYSAGDRLTILEILEEMVAQMADADAKDVRRVMQDDPIGHYNDDWFGTERGSRKPPIWPVLPGR